MHNISTRKATRNDFENIYSLILKELDNTNIVKDDWKNLFENHWCKPDDFFGHDIELIGDLDGDGVTDIAVGVPYDNDGANSAGAVYILFLNSDGTVKSSQKISSSEIRN